MNKVMIRSLLIVFGIILLLLGGYFLISNILNIVDSFFSSGLSTISNLFDFRSVFLLILGFLFFFIGKNWSDSFKAIAAMLVSLSILFFTFGTFFYSINTNTQDIKDSIQPTIDQIFVSSMDTLLNEQISEPNQKTFEIVYSNNSVVEKYYISNVSQSQAEKLLERLDLKSQVNENSSVAFVKFFLNTLYKNLESTQPKQLDAPLPVDMIKNELENQGFSVTMLTLIDSPMLENVDVEKNAYLNILFSQNSSSMEIDITSLEKNEVEVIWKTLDFSNNISYQSKKQYIEIFFNLYSSQLSQSAISSSIPLDTLSHMMSSEVKSIFGYDLFSINYSYRAEQLMELRKDCSQKNDSFEEICEPILMTKYENLMTLAKNVSNISSQTQLSRLEEFNISNLISSVETREKIGNTLDEKTQYWKTFYFLSFLFLVFALVIYYLHFKVFDRELILAHVPYYIFKVNLIHSLINLVLFSIGLYLLVSGIGVEFISSMIPLEIFSDFSIFDLKIFEVFQNILWDMFYIYLIYVIFVFAVYIGLFFWLKSEVNEISQKNF